MKSALQPAAILTALFLAAGVANSQEPPSQEQAGQAVVSYDRVIGALERQQEAFNSYLNLITAVMAVAALFFAFLQYRDSKIQEQNRQLLEGQAESVGQYLEQSGEVMQSSAVFITTMDTTLKSADEMRKRINLMEEERLQLAKARADALIDFNRRVRQQGDALTREDIKPRKIKPIMQKLQIEAAGQNYRPEELDANYFLITGWHHEFYENNYKFAAENYRLALTIADRGKGYDDRFIAKATTSLAFCEQRLGIYNPDLFAAPCFVNHGKHYAKRCGAQTSLLRMRQRLGDNPMGPADYNELSAIAHVFEELHQLDRSNTDCWPENYQRHHSRVSYWLASVTINSVTSENDATEREKLDRSLALVTEPGIEENLLRNIILFDILLSLHRRHKGPFPNREMIAPWIEDCETEISGEGNELERLTNLIRLAHFQAAFGDQDGFNLSKRDAKRIATHRLKDLVEGEDERAYSPFSRYHVHLRKIISEIDNKLLYQEFRPNDESKTDLS